MSIVYGNRITNLGSPVAASDAATMAYVDATSGGGGGGGGFSNPATVDLDMSGNNITQTGRVGIGLVDPLASLHIMDVNDVSMNSVTDADNSAYTLILEKNTVTDISEQLQ